MPGPVALPMAQLVLVLRLKPGRGQLAGLARDRATNAVKRWLIRWERRNAAVVQYSSIAIAQADPSQYAAAGPLLVHWRALVMVPAEWRGWANAAVNRPINQPAQERIQRATAGEVAAVRGGRVHG